MANVEKLHTHTTAILLMILINIGLVSDNYEPSTSKTKIKIVRNGRNSPQHSRQEPEESGSSTEAYRYAPVKSEIR